MEKRVFRKDCETKLSSPEDLKVYIKSTKLSYWALIVAIFVCLAGMGCWLIFGKIQIDVEALCVIEDGTINIYYGMEDDVIIKPGLEVLGLPESYQLPESVSQPVYVYATELPEFERIKGEMEDTAVLCRVTDSTDMPNGIYETLILAEHIVPFRLIFWR